MMDVYPSQPFVAVGDVHGDYDLLVRILVMADIIDEHVKWTGGSTLVVFTGDMVDTRRPGMDDWTLVDGSVATNQQILRQELRVLQTLSDLDKQARRQGGAVIRLLGNHELVQMMGHRNYAETYSHAGQIGRRAVDARMRSFQPGGDFYRLLQNRRRFLCCVKIGKWVLCHAGFSPSLVKQLRRKRHPELAIRTASDLVERTNQFLNTFIRRGGSSSSISRSNVETMLFAGDSSESMMHFRGWSSGESDCRNVGLGLDPENLHLIVGHSVQSNHLVGWVPPFVRPSTKSKTVYGWPLVRRTDCSVGINADCSGRVWRIDTGSSRAFSFTGNNECRVRLRAAQCLAVDENNNVSINVERKRFN